MKVKITADSTVDLSPELVEKYNITIVPLCVNLGDDIFEDGKTINPDQIYNFVAATKKLPKTSAVNAETYKEYFNKVFAEGYDQIIHLNISGEMSTSHQSAKLAADELKNVFVIDSANLSTGMGIQAIYASELAQTGKYTAEQIVQKVVERQQNICAGFILDKLEYLYRGGRCSALSMLGANLLKLKPIIEVHNGKMGMYGKCLGKFENCVSKYVSQTLEKYNTPDTTRVFITHTKIDPAIVETVKQHLKQNTQFKEIIETTAGATITSHCGPNTIGILFYNDGEGHY